MQTTLNINIYQCGDSFNTVNDWITRDCTLNINGLPLGRFVDLQLVLVSGASALYSYFPFLLEFKVSPDHIELFEIDGAEKSFSFRLHGLLADQNGKAVVKIIAEIAGIPKELDLGPDERELVAHLSSVSVHSGAQYPPMNRYLPDDCSIYSGAHIDVVRPGPVFILGCYRSGTSVLSWALGQHPNLLVLEETNWLSLSFLGAVAGYRQASRPKRNAPEIYDLNQNQFLRWIGQGFDSMHLSIGHDHALHSIFHRLSYKNEGYNPNYQLIRSRWNPKRRWVDGTPENTGIATLLEQAFPASQFIGLIRNPKNVVTSLIHFDRAGGESFEMNQALTYWLRMTELLMRFSEVLGPQRVKVVFYEDMIENPQNILQGLFSFLGEPNFSKAADTFTDKINSSRIGRNDLEKMKGTEIDAAESIFLQLRTGVPASKIKWGPQSIDNLDELINHMVETIIKAVS